MRNLSILVILLLSGCSSFAKEKDESIAWRFQLATPKHYNVWVEHLEFERSGVRHWSHPAGSMGCCWKGPEGPRGVAGRMEPFPNYIGIQWFSFAEQKFYQRLISIPREWQRLMEVPALYKTSLGEFEAPRDTLTLGLAPGGEIVVWIMNQIGNEKEIARLQANEIEGEIFHYKTRTKAYLNKHGDYLKQQGIPLDGW
ncbi:MAG: DUF2931 family protein [Marinobacter sp.]